MSVGGLSKTDDSLNASNSTMGSFTFGSNTNGVGPMSTFTFGSSSGIKNETSPTTNRGRANS